MISQAGRWTQTPSITPLQPIKWNAHFWITFNFWWSAGLVSGLKPHSPPLCSQKNEMLIVWLCSTSDDQLGWSMDLNPICHPSPAYKMKYSFSYYIQFLMFARLVNGLKPHPPPLCSQKNEILLLWITLNFWWLAGLSDGLKPHPPPLSSQKKWNVQFSITFNFWWSAKLVNWLKVHLPALSSQ